MTNKYSRFIDLLKTMFELDKSDLDFGIYRIINIRSKQIIDFLENKLQQKVYDALSTVAINDTKIKGRIDEIEKICSDAGISPDKSDKFKEEYAELKAQLSNGANITELETDVYSALYNFFNRYYDKGDFISKRRYKEGVYAIPYEGEEVKLYWANHDQYYIKSAENFKDYAFTVDNGKKTVHFRLVDATTETANNKENGTNKRTFMLLKENFIEENENELIIKFIYDIPVDNKIKYADDNLKRINDIILSDYKEWVPELLINVPTVTDKKRTLIQKHLNDYVAKNTFDYFIHKDLKGFLERELDFFIKSEVMRLDDIDTDNEVRVSSYLAKVKAIKRVGKDIIAFLAQIEDFQKKLWLKKKFVVETNWCITLDKIDEKFYEDIANNAAQIEEWIDMYAINEIDGDLTTPSFCDPLTVEFLKTNKNLIVDTKNFTEEFKDRLIASIDNLDEETCGVLIHSENFQALNLLIEKYNSEINGIYIDPPFNATFSEILYKNNYKHSSWLSLMSSRLSLSRTILSNEGITTVAIDDYEMNRLWELMSNIYGYDNHLGTISIRINPKGRMTNRKVSSVHEYTILFGNSDSSQVKKLPESPEEKTHNYQKDIDGTWYLPVNLRKQGVDSEAVKADGSLAERYFPIYYDEINNKISVTEKYEIEIYPIDSSGNKRIWRRGFDVIENMFNSGDIWVNRTKDGYQVYFKFRGGLDGKMVQSMWTDPQCSASDYGTKILDNILGKREIFSYPKAPFAVTQNILAMSNKSDAIILDFFAGSGTTAHSIININRNDSGKRKYILIEVAEYFNTVTKPRIKKIVYSTEWKNGKPQNRNTGVSHIMKYMRLESYEDTLQNVELDDEKHTFFSSLGDKYLISYMLNTESEDSLLSIDKFKTPFDYKLKITEKNESKKRKIDICETFNYLIGLYILRQSEIKRYAVKPNENGTYEGAVKINLDVNGEYLFKTYEGKLRTGEKTLVIWRTMTDDLLKDNAVLDAFFEKNYINPQDREYDLIFINGDNNIENLRSDGETWKINLIELEMKKLMFEED